MAVRKIVSKMMMFALSGAALVASGLIFSSNSEEVLRDSFAVALKDAPTAEQVRAPDRVASAPIAGSEEYWLTAMRSENALPVTRVISIGDRIALRLGGNSRQLVVSSVSELAPQATEIDTRSGQSRTLLITAQEAGNRAAPPIRFLMEIETPATTVSAAAGRVL